MQPACFDYTVDSLIQQSRLKRSDVDQIKIWLKQENLPDLCDEQIACFLVSCNNEQETTRTTIKAHYTYKKNLPELFNERNVDSEDVKTLLKFNYYVLLPHRTPEGAAVIYYGVKSPVSGRYTPISMKIFLMLFEMICKENPPTSLILLYDFKNVGLMNLATVKISYVRNFINYLQEGLPLTLKKIYVLNVTSLMSFINSLAKPFMKPEIFNKIRVLQASTAKETLHQEIGIEFLPKELEGKLPTIDNLQDRTTEKLREMYHFFEAEQQQRRNC